ncbi:ABC transporter permease [Rhodanobacter sp. 7MK24]|uniref:ABC transporter permease n=1 Tax=Rhodanobacter sp. 7MK24 TaxID=2775922 RepID=UPI00177ED9BF|nr:FtsX-like permease family protein [Rhodanobacter sp. 7MK24]MBD8879050.1 ABC transporter permease [Rhodanobacter sp. 7MK24]
MSLRIHFSTLRRQSLMPLLVLLQVTLACAILCNVMFLTWQQMEPMLASSGVDTANLILIDQLVAADGKWTAADVRAGTRALHEVPGVRAVSPAHSLPMTFSTIYAFGMLGSTGVKVGVNVYAGEGLRNTLDIPMVEGRDFLSGEYRAMDGYKGVPMPVIVTQALARKLFGNADALGQQVADPDEPAGAGYRIVGIVRHLLRNQLDMATSGRADDTMLMPQRVGDTAMPLSYAVRVDPAMREVALRDVSKAIQSQFGMRQAEGVKVQVSFYDTRSGAAFKSRRAALWLFGGVSLTVVIVTVIGIMGLTGFWVQKRTRHIGIHRALGARRIDILHYFLAENALIVGIGVVLGMALAYFGNAWLMRYYELQRLPWPFLAYGAALMLMLGQVAVLSPALRAARVPPVMATRGI